MIFKNLTAMLPNRGPGKCHRAGHGREEEEEEEKEKKNEKKI